MTNTNNIPTRTAALDRRRREAAERQTVYDALPQSDKDARNPKKVKA